MKSHVLHTMWCNISGEAEREIWKLSLLGVKGFNSFLCFPSLRCLSPVQAWPIASRSTWTRPASPSWAPSCRVARTTVPTRPFSATAPPATAGASPATARKSPTPKSGARLNVSRAGLPLPCPYPNKFSLTSSIRSCGRINMACFCVYCACAP